MIQQNNYRISIHLLQTVLTSHSQCYVALAAGHSLGVALATLAAYDIHKQLLDNRQINTKVVCYTFAAPRTGNHAFAREYNAMVPNAWSVINDQVTHLNLLLLLSSLRVCTD